ncbi:MAG: Voltage-gated ClC-type chloride channel ClcB [Chlamydiae bacterium]|nr:Voltage-gated ClC-type chloride channel ClcB [Chlamydiota bacterium]
MKEEDSNKKYAKKDDTGFFTETHPFRLYLVSALVGIVSAFSTVGFIKLYALLRKVIYFSKNSNFIQISYDVPAWYFFLIFIGGGTLISLLIYYLLPNTSTRLGMPHLLFNFRKQRTISVVEGLGSSAASCLSIGMGASVGREAPLMFLAGSITSWFCKILKFNGHYYRILLCAAIATAFSTSLHSTFVAIFFVLEVVSFSLAAVDLVPIAIAIFSGTIVREFFPDILPPIFLNYSATSDVHHIIYFAVLGLLCGFLAFGFVQSMKFTVSAHINSKLPSWIWPSVGGVALSLIAIYAPAAMGLSFDIVQSSEHILTPSLKFVILFIIFKILATYFSVGFGFSGGVISPVFVVGIFLGVLYALGLEAIFPQTSFDYSIYALGATTAFTSAVIGAPLALTIASFELTHSMPLTLNIFIAVVIAQLVMKFLKTGSFYQTQYTLLYDD